MPEDELIIREAQPDDCDFALDVKRAAFREYIEQVYGWDEEFQRKLHEERFASQPFWIVSWQGQDVGIMAGETSEGDLRLYQLFLLPQFQGRGIGRLCMERWMSQAQEVGLPLRLRVLKVNPRAKAFYERLGFAVVGDDGTHDVMVWDSVRR